MKMSSSNSTTQEEHDNLERALVESLDKDEKISLDLYTACLIGDFATVRQFISSGVELDRKNKRGGWTALMYAAYVGRDTIVNLLLDSGADVDIATPKMGTTALMLASDCGNESIVYFLLQQGAKVNLRDKKGQTALFHAVEGGHINVVKLLLDCDADVEAGQSLTQLTPLMVAAIEGHGVIFSMLIEYGANLHAKSQFGETAVTLATSFGNVTIINIIENMYQTKDSACLRGEAGLIDSDADVLDGPEKIERLAREARKASKNKEADVKSSNVMRSRDMVSPIDARDYEPVGESYSQTDWTELEKDFSDMTMGSKPPNAEPRAANEQGLQGEISQTIVIPKRKSKVSRVCYEPPKQPFLVTNQIKQPMETLGDVLDGLNLTKYYSCFEREDIDMETFLTLNDEDLKQIGINKLGPRKKLISYIQNYSKSRHSENKVESGTGNDEGDIAFQKDHAYVEYLRAQVHKEKQGRHELESYFVAERGRLDQIHKSSKQLKSTMNEMLSFIDGLRANCESSTEGLASVYKDLTQENKSARKNIEEALDFQKQSLDIASELASKVSLSFKMNEYITGLCTKGHSAES